MPPKGYVYFMQEKLHGSIKIGFTSSIHERMLNFGIRLPFDIELVHVIYSENATETEQLFHTQYSAKRLNGEWFRIDDEDIHQIKTCKFPDVIQQSIAGKYYRNDQTEITSKNVFKIPIKAIQIPDNLKQQQLNAKKTKTVKEYMIENQKPYKEVRVIKSNNQYTLLAGHREVMIAKELGWKDIEAIVL